MTIETIHRCRIDFTINREDIRQESYIICQIADKIHEFKKVGIEIIVVNKGGPCCQPYIIFEGKNLPQIEAFETKILQYIALRKGEVLL